MNHALLNSGDDWNPERHARQQRGLSDAGVIVDLSRYLGVKVDPRLLVSDEGLNRWASRHAKEVNVCGNTATFTSPKYEFHVMAHPMATTVKYSGDIVLRRNGKHVHATGEHSKIPNVLHEFQNFIAYQKEKGRDGS